MIHDSILDSILDENEILTTKSDHYDIISDGKCKNIAGAIIWLKLFRPNFGPK